uniref:Uncharacterized protein n=1 Tax=Podarcis muralis TaxID=64176 RepID=A0A670HYG3_PODMU
CDSVYNLRKQARQLENELDLKLVSFSKLCTSYSHSSSREGRRDRYRYYCPTFLLFLTFLPFQNSFCFKPVFSLFFLSFITQDSCLVAYLTQFRGCACAPPTIPNCFYTT